MKAFFSRVEPVPSLFPCREKRTSYTVLEVQASFPCTDNYVPRVGPEFTHIESLTLRMLQQFLPHTYTHGGTVIQTSLDLSRRC